ncbi:protein kinase C and casein kinase substrate in neurons protein 1 isoform X1 [Hydra vulgaris]|uniref:Protein kinase C and casein kinase substrate in neurons protein 1 isoform X1 n=1 Tax=Hydra vulgaris TaxID=6087 RepID=A0ABM4BD27_HYDVU
MANRRGTTNKKSSEMGSNTINNNNFWDIDNYQRCVKRIGESSALCDDLVKMFNERIEIEAKYGKKLDDWHEKWSKALENSCMYATTKIAALGTIKEAQDRAKVHMDCCMKMQNQVIETIKRWKESNYHHKIFGLKEAKEYEQEFAKAQKQWANAYNKIQKAKGNYHSACKNREACASLLNNAKQDTETLPEKIKKLEDSLRKSENAVSTMQQKYDEKLKRISPLNITYESDMQQVYNKWAKDEEKRLDFLQRTLIDFHKCVNIYADPRLKELFDNQINAAYNAKIQYDVNWWSENFGAGMPKNWPKFEGYSPLEWHHWNLCHLARNQSKQLRRYTTRPRPYELKSRINVLEPGESVIEPHQIAPVESSSSFHSNSINQRNGVKSQQQVVSNTVSNLASNPFVNGERDAGDDDDDDDEWDAPLPELIPGGGIRVRAIYDYTRVEDDELSFKAGDVLIKLTEEDAQGWCRGSFNGQEGLYPANYVGAI